jgi:hypothetical protein
MQIAWICSENIRFKQFLNKDALFFEFPLEFVFQSMAHDGTISIQWESEDDV